MPCVVATGALRFLARAIGCGRTPSAEQNAVSHALPADVDASVGPQGVSALATPVLRRCTVQPWMIPMRGSKPPNP
jgi:hypothetical protein